MTPRNIPRLIDFAFCLVLLPALVMLLPIDKWWQDNSSFVILLLGWLYATYWLHRTITVSLFYGERRRPSIAIAIVAISLILTFMLSHYQLDFSTRMAEEISRRAAHGRPPRPIPPVNKMLEQAVWFLYVVVTTLSVVVSLLSELNRQIIARQSVEFEKKKAELALYKAQINPHFLFNTLNTLLGLIITKSEQTEEAFMQFSNMMRYMCNSSTQDWVGIETEIEYIEEYISLQRYRLNRNTQIEFIHDGDSVSYGATIAPMLLITFVENAIKYGSSSHLTSTIQIKIELRDGTLHLTTHNPILHSSSESNRGSGIGISNCRKRLELLYPSRHTLQINHGEREYRVSLTIKLN